MSSGSSGSNVPQNNKWSSLSSSQIQSLQNGQILMGPVGTAGEHGVSSPTSTIFSTGSSTVSSRRSKTMPLAAHPSLMKKQHIYREHCEDDGFYTVLTAVRRRVALSLLPDEPPPCDPLLSFVEAEPTPFPLSKSRVKRKRGFISQSKHTTPADNQSKVLFTRGYWTPIQNANCFEAEPNVSPAPSDVASFDACVSSQQPQFRADKFLLRNKNSQENLEDPSDDDGCECDTMFDSCDSGTLSGCSEDLSENEENAGSEMAASQLSQKLLATGTNAQAWQRAKARFSSRTSTLGLDETSQSPSLTLPKLVSGFLGSSKAAMDTNYQNSTTSVLFQWEPPKTLSFHHLMDSASKSEKLDNLEMSACNHQRMDSLELGTSQRRSVRFCEMDDPTVCARVDVDTACPVHYTSLKRTQDGEYMPLQKSRLQSLSSPSNTLFCAEDDASYSFFSSSSNIKPSTAIRTKFNDNIPTLIEENESECDTDNMSEVVVWGQDKDDKTKRSISSAAKESACSAASSKPCPYILPLPQKGDPTQCTAIVLKAPGDRGEYSPHVPRVKEFSPIEFAGENPEISEGEMRYIRIVRDKGCSRAGIGLTVGPGYINAPHRTSESSVENARMNNEKGSASCLAQDSEHPCNICLEDELDLGADDLVLHRRMWAKDLLSGDLKQKFPYPMKIGKDIKSYRPVGVEPGVARLRGSHPLLWVSVPLVPMTSIVLADVQLFVIAVVPVSVKPESELRQLTLSEALDDLALAREAASESDCSILKAPAGFKVLLSNRELPKGELTGCDDWSRASMSYIFIPNLTVPETMIPRDMDHVLAYGRYRWAENSKQNSLKSVQVGESDEKCTTWRQKLASDLTPGSRMLPVISHSLASLGAKNGTSNELVASHLELPCTEALKRASERIGGKKGSVIGFFDCYSNQSTPMDEKKPSIKGLNQPGAWPSPWLTVNVWSPQSVGAILDRCHCGNCSHLESDTNNAVFDSEVAPLRERMLVWHASRSEDSFSMAKELQNRLIQEKVGLGGVEHDDDQFIGYEFDKSILHLDQQDTQSDGHESDTTSNSSEGGSCSRANRPPEIPANVGFNDEKGLGVSNIPVNLRLLPELDISHSAAPTPVHGIYARSLTQTAADSARIGQTGRLSPGRIHQKVASAANTPTTNDAEINEWKHSIDVHSLLNNKTQTQEKVLNERSVTKSNIIDSTASDYSAFSSSAAITSFLRSMFVSPSLCGRIPISQGDIVILSRNIWLRVDLKQSADRVNGNALTITKNSMSTSPLSCLDVGSSADPNFEAGLVAAVSIVTPSRASAASSLLSGVSSAATPQPTASSGSTASTSSRDRGPMCMEDRLCFVDGFGGHPNHAFAAVFDGHCGDRTVADFASCALHSNVAEAMTAELRVSRRSLTLDRVCLVLRRAVARLVSQLEGLMDAARYAGSTMSAALLWTHPISRRPYLFSATLGDSRAMLCNDGFACEINEEHALHKVSYPEEAARLRRENASAQGGRLFGLSVSRALGDMAMWPKGLSSQPSITCRRISPLDSHLVVCSDGVTDVLSPASICSLLLDAEVDLSESSIVKNQMPSGASSLLSVLPRSPHHLRNTSQGNNMGVTLSQGLVSSAFKPLCLAIPESDVGEVTGGVTPSMTRGVPGSRSFGRQLSSTNGQDGLQGLSQVLREKETKKLAEKLAGDIKRSIFGRYLRACYKAGLRPRVPKPLLPSIFSEPENTQDFKKVSSEQNEVDDEFDNEILDPVKVLRHWFVPFNELDHESKHTVSGLVRQALEIENTVANQENSNVDNDEVKREIMKAFRKQWLSRPADSKVWEQLYDLYVSKSSVPCNSSTLTWDGQREMQDLSLTPPSTPPSRVGESESGSARLSRHTLRFSASNTTATALAELLTREARNRGTDDNMSVIVVRLNPAVLPRGVGAVLLKEAKRRHALAVIKDVARARLQQLESHYLQQVGKVGFEVEATNQNADAGTILEEFDYGECDSFEGEEAVADVDEFYLGEDEHSLLPSVADLPEGPVDGDTFDASEYVNSGIYTIIIEEDAKSASIEDASNNTLSKFSSTSEANSDNLLVLNAVAAVGQDEVKMSKSDVVEYTFEKDLERAKQEGRADFYARYAARKTQRQANRKKSKDTKRNATPRDLEAATNDPKKETEVTQIANPRIKPNRSGHFRVSSDELYKALGLVDELMPLAQRIEKQFKNESLLSTATASSTSVTHVVPTPPLSTPEPTMIGSVIRSPALTAGCESHIVSTPDSIKSTTTAPGFAPGSNPSQQTADLKSGPSPFGNALAGLLSAAPQNRPRGASVPKPALTGLLGQQNLASSRIRSGADDSSTEDIRSRLLRQLDKQIDHGWVVNRAPSSPLPSESKQSGLLSQSSPMGIARNMPLAPISNLFMTPTTVHKVRDAQSTEAVKSNEATPLLKSSFSQRDALLDLKDLASNPMSENLLRIKDTPSIGQSSENREEIMGRQINEEKENRRISLSRTQSMSASSCDSVSSATSVADESGNRVIERAIPIMSSSSSSSSSSSTSTKLNTSVQKNDENAKSRAVSSSDVMSSKARSLAFQLKFLRKVQETVQEGSPKEETDWKSLSSPLHASDLDSVGKNHYTCPPSPSHSLALNEVGKYSSKTRSPSRVSGLSAAAASAGSSTSSSASSSSASDFPNIHPSAQSWSYFTWVASSNPTQVSLQNDLRSRAQQQTHALSQLHATPSHAPISRDRSRREIALNPGSSLTSSSTANMSVRQIIGSNMANDPARFETPRGRAGSSLLSIFSQSDEAPNVP